ncbi:MAG: hypothetical protein QXR30_03005 [Candidatus Woesearchaeota archaeon]
MKDKILITKFEGNLRIEKEAEIFIYGTNQINLEILNNCKIFILANEKNRIMINKVTNSTININAVSLSNLEIFVYGKDEVNIEIDVIKLKGSTTVMPALLINGIKKAKHSALIQPLNKEFLFYLKSKNVKNPERVIIYNHLNITEDEIKIVDEILEKNGY